MKVVFWIIVVLVAAMLALFAVSNRESITLGLWPFSFGIDLPLYLAILTALLIGFVAGALAAVIAGRGRRREIRRRGRRIAVLERELTRARAEPADGNLPAVSSLRG